MNTKDNMHTRREIESRSLCMRVMAANTKACFWLAYMVIVMWGAALASTSRADTPYELTYSGRFVDKTGAPLKGPLALNIEFYSTATGGTPKGGSFNYSAVAMEDGIFQVTISLGASLNSHAPQII